MALLAGASFNSSVPAPAPLGPSILLVTIDTLRADRLGVYGYAMAKTPVLDQLAASGVRFADATSHVPLTYPSHVSILTGRYPGAFGIRLNGMDPLPDSVTTIAERMKGAGYRTGAVIASVVLDQSYGLAQGFDDYDDRIAMPSLSSRDTIAIAELQRPADQVTASARAWIARQSVPWFLWVHYYDPHTPYEAPAKYAALAPNRPYDAEIAYVDASLGGLLASVDRQRTAVIVTSDHGEALGEHGEPDHGLFLYDATLRVPLIVAAPGLAPRIVAEQVRSIDVAPTIAALAGIRPPPGEPAPGEPAPGDPANVTGESLVPLLQGQRRGDVPVSFAESWYPRLHFGWSELRSARVGEWKYIAAPKPELYDLRVDRAEARNVAAARASVASRLAADVARIAGAFAQPDGPRGAAPDGATVERLQSLGYVGTFAPVTAGKSAENPADHIVQYRQYRDLFNRALGALGRGRPVEAQTLLQRLLKLNVRAFEAHLYLGNAYAAQGKHDAALGEYDAASQLNPALSTPHFEAAKVLSSQGGTAGAVARAQKGLEREPRSSYGYYTLGVVHQRASQWVEASIAFARAVELNGMDPRARANLASVSMRLGNLEVAGEQFEQMIELGYRLAPAQFNLGVIAARRGNVTEAARRYRLALLADPTFAPARDALGRIR